MRAQFLIDNFDDMKDGGGLAGALGARWWKIGVSGGAVTALSAADPGWS